MVSIAPKSLLLIGLAAAIVAPAPHDAPSVACARPVLAREGLALARAVWPPDRWRRGKPGPAALRAHRTQLRCAAGPGHRKAIRRRWRIERRSYFEHRRAMLATLRWEPYVCGSRRYALPCAVTECESGFVFTWHSGAYGLLDSTWDWWGGQRFAPYPGAATPRQQAIIARTVWEAVGPSGWECPL